MSTVPNSEVLELLQIIFPTNLRDEMVDAMLQLDELSGFNIATIDGHSRKHGDYDKVERVVGHRRMHRLEVVVNAAQKQQVFDALRQCAGCGKARLRYYATAVTDSGHI